METPIRVLVVDDDPRMVKTLVDILRAKGHAPRGVHSGEEALDLLEVARFDCAVTDIRMGTMDGLTLFRSLRNAGHMLPVVFMTAYADEEMVRQGLNEGVVGAITKPFDMERLLTFLNRARNAGSVLIVDDDPEFCLAVENALAARGFSVRHVSTAALDGVLCPEHHAIVLNTKFDRAAGLEILGAIRRRCGSVPVILLAGPHRDTGGGVDESLRKEVHACLDNPVDVDRLLALLGELHQAKLRRLLVAPAAGDR